MNQTGQKKPSASGQPSRPMDSQKRDGAENDNTTQREKSLDKTIADTFPSSDPPSSNPNPAGNL